MPRLLMVTTVPVTLTGFMLPFVAHFRARGFRVDGMARQISNCPECREAFDQVWDVDWSRNPLDPANLLRAPARIRALVEREGYDLVHVHTPVASFVTRFALRQMRKQNRLRVIYTAHGFHFYEGGPKVKGAIFRNLEKLAGRWTDYLVVINREDEQAVRRYQIVPPDRLRFMPGIGVDLQQYGPESVSEEAIARVRQELSLPADAALFFMVAEFIPRKHHRDLLNAFARLNRANAYLALAGDGPLQDEMKQLAGSLGIGDRVRFLGFRRDIPVLMRAAQANILPSEQEGLPRSLLESLSLGVPSIGSRIRGNTDLLEGGQGLLFSVGAVEELAQALAQILDHPDQAQTLAEKGRQAIAQYDLQNILRLHEDLYAEALGSLPRNRQASPVEQGVGSPVS